MRKEEILKAAVKCTKCKSIVERAEIRELYLCDQCGKKMVWEQRFGFPFYIRLYHDNETCSCGQIIPEYDFCSIRCGLKWFKTKAVKEWQKHCDGKFKHYEFSIRDPKSFKRFLAR